MGALGHILLGLGLFVLALVLGLLATHVDRSPEARISMTLVRLLSLGSVQDRQHYLRRLRVGYAGMATISLVAAILLWVSA